MWSHTFIWCNKNWLLTEYNNKNCVITRRRCLRIICVPYKHLLKRGLVTWKDDASTVSRFCSGDCWWGLFIFQFYNTCVNCYNFSSTLSPISKTTLVQPILPVSMRINKSSSRTRMCLVTQGCWRWVPLLLAGRGWGCLLDSTDCLCPRHDALTSLTIRPEAKPSHGKMFRVINLLWCGAPVSRNIHTDHTGVLFV